MEIITAPPSTVNEPSQPANTSGEPTTMKEYIFFKMHHLWRLSFPSYPEQVTVSRTLVYENGCKMHFDMVLYGGVYLFVFMMEPDICSFSRFRSDVLPNDDLGNVISRIVNERYQRFATMTNLIKSIAYSPQRNMLLFEFNKLQGGSILESTKQNIRKNYRYARATDNVIEQHFLQYIQTLDYSFARTIPTTAEEVAEDFFQSMKTADWLIPEPDFDDSDAE